MSTRCMILLSDHWDCVLLYRHSDGYPEGAGEDLKRFFREKRFGYDTHLNSAEQVGHALILWHARQGVRVQPANTTHGDLEYMYLVDLPAEEYVANRENLRTRIRVYKVNPGELGGLGAREAREALEKLEPAETHMVPTRLWDSPPKAWAGERELVAGALLEVGKWTLC